MRQSIGHGAALQGNLDPVVLTTTPDITRREALRVLDEAGDQPGFIFNLGHGMIPSTKIECVEALMEVVLARRTRSCILGFRQGKPHATMTTIGAGIISRVHDQKTNYVLASEFPQAA